MADEGDLNKVNGDSFYAGDVTALLTSQGSIFNDTAQNLFNADYIGFDSRLYNTGVPNLKNVEYSTFTSDDADVNIGFDYDSTNDMYYLPDIGDYYVVVEATSASSTAYNYNSNNCKVTGDADGGKWIVFSTSADAEVQRAEVLKSLFYGTNGSNPIITEFTSVTAVKSPDARDTGKRAHYAYAYKFEGNSAGTLTGTFVDTSTNTDCSSWSICSGSGYGFTTSDEFGTDTSADELDNPATCQLECYNYSPSGYSRWEIASGATKNTATAYNYVTDNAWVKALVVCSGDITWVDSNLSTGTDTFTTTDFFTDESIPDFTLASIADVEEATLIFKDTASESVTNCIPVINSTIDASSSEQISVSADGGSNWTDVDNAEIARPTAGTALWRRIVITRTDLSVEDNVTEQAVKYNLY